MMEVTFATCVAITIALTELFKRTGLIKDNYMAFISLFFGLALGIFYVVPGNIPQGIFQGLIIGLSASGLFSGVKNTVKGVKK